MGVRICNHIFANMVASRDITGETELRPSSDTAAEYRRGFWNELGRSLWDHDVAPRGDMTKQASQSAKVRRASSCQELLIFPSLCCQAHGT